MAESGRRKQQASNASNSSRWQVAVCSPGYSSSHSFPAPWPAPCRKAGSGRSALLQEWWAHLHYGTRCFMPPTSNAITGMPLRLAESPPQCRDNPSAARSGFGQKTRPSGDILAHQRLHIIVPPWPGKDQSGPCKMWELKWDQIFRNSTLSCKNNTIKWLTGARRGLAFVVYIAVIYPLFY